MPVNNQDLVAGFDPTLASVITSSDLKAIVDAAEVYTDKGLIIVTSDIAAVPDVPDANTTTKWQNCLWIRKTSSAVIPYVWNQTAGTNYENGHNMLKWYPISISSIGVGTITTDMIADLAITDDKVANASVDYSKLKNTPTGLPPTGAAGGVLGGTYPAALTLANNAVTTATIADANVTNAKLEAASATTGIVIADKIKPNTVGNTIMRTNNGATAVEWAVVDAANVTKLANITAGDSLKYVRVNVGETAYEKVSAATLLGYILLQDSKAANTAGGTFTAGSWAKRTIAEVSDTEDLATVSSSVIVLAAGTYRCRISCPASEVGVHQARLYNTSASATIVTGTTEDSDTTTPSTSRSEIVGVFTIAAAQNLEIQHRCTTTKNTDGFGPLTNWDSEPCIFTIAEFWKIA